LHYVPYKGIKAHVVLTNEGASLITNASDVDRIASTQNTAFGITIYLPAVWLCCIFCIYRYTQPQDMHSSLANKGCRRPSDCLPKAWKMYPRKPGRCCPSMFVSELFAVLAGVWVTRCFDSMHVCWGSARVPVSTAYAICLAIASSMLAHSTDGKPCNRCRLPCP
jgi:hypothetical protein